MDKHIIRNSTDVLGNLVVHGEISGLYTDNWNSAWSTVMEQSGSWGVAASGDFITKDIYGPASGNWQSTWETVRANSAVWSVNPTLSASDIINDSDAVGVNVMDALNNLDIDLTAVENTVSAAPSWNSTYTTVLANSGTWSSASSISGALDASITSLTDNDILHYQTTSLKWINSKHIPISTLPLSGIWTVQDYIGINNPVAPTDLLHLYGTSTTPDADDIIHNNLVLDGSVSGDKGIWWNDDGKASFNQYLYRNEKAQYLYMWNQESERDLWVLSRQGKFGFNKQSNFLDYHTFYHYPTLGAVNDLDFGGEYARSFEQIYEVSIYEGILDSAKNKIFTETSNWSGGASWVQNTTSGSFTHTPGDTTDLVLLNSGNIINGFISTGNQYKLMFDVVGMTAGGVTPYVGAVAGTSVVADADKIEQFILAPGNNSNISFAPSTGFNGTIRNVSLIRTVNSHDTYRWRASRNNEYTWGSYSAFAEILAGVDIAIENGLTLTFGSDTGHNGSDVWHKIAFGQLPQASVSVAPIAYTEVINTATMSSSAATYTDITYNCATQLASPTVFMPLGSDSAVYIGLEVPFYNITVNLSVPAVGCTLKAEYWNGSAWSELGATHYFIDNTSNMTVNGEINFDATTFNDWTKTYPTNHVEDEYFLHWIRLSSVTEITVAPETTIVAPHGQTRFAVYAAHKNAIPALKVDCLGRVLIGGDGNVTSNNILQVVSTYNKRVSEGLTTSPFIEFDSNTNSKTDLVLRLSDESSSSPRLIISNSRGTLETPTNLQTSDIVGNFSNRAYVSGGWHGMSCIETTYVGDGSSLSGNLKFKLAKGASTVQTIATMKPDKINVDYGTGKESIVAFTDGTTSPNGGIEFGISTAGNGLVRQLENKPVEFYTNGAQRLNIEADGSVQFYSVGTEYGIAINKFSDDATLSGNSSSTLVSERAIKTLIESKFAKALTGGITPSTPGNFGDLGYYAGYAYYWPTSGSVVRWVVETNW